MNEITAEAPYLVGVVYDTFNEAVRSQIFRDIMALKATADIALVDPQGLVDPDPLQVLGVSVMNNAKPQFIIVYKTGANYPEFDQQTPNIKRDMQVIDKSPKLYQGPRFGYYLRPQGRDGANMTELYLNRSHPRGTGIVDSMIALIWGVG